MLSVNFISITTKSQATEVKFHIAPDGMQGHDYAFSISRNATAAQYIGGATALRQIVVKLF
jgi:hypothetical protein